MASMLVGLLGVAPVAFAKNPNPGVRPPYAKAYGLTYGEWSAAWWQWALSLPVGAHPLFDTADCSAGQSGKVFFLGGTFVTTTDPSGTVVGEAERDCREWEPGDETGCFHKAVRRESPAPRALSHP